MGSCPLSIKAVLLGLICLNIQLSECRRQCTPPIQSGVIHGHCNSTQFWLEDIADVLPTLSAHSDHEDDLIIGVTGLLVKPLLEADKVFGNVSAIWHNKLYALETAISLETTAAAYPKAIADFCGQKLLNLHFIVVYLADMCVASDVIQMIEILEAGVDVIFGLPCSAGIKSSQDCSWKFSVLDSY